VSSSSGVHYKRHINGDLAQKLSLSIEQLDSAVTAIRNVDISLSVDRNAMRSIELPGFASRFTQDLSHLPSLSTLAIRELM
jgi:hypothetical protein